MSLKKNILSLGIVQVFIYVVPLIQLPYLSRVLGVEHFGLFAFTLSTIQFLNILTDFGFNMYFPQKIVEGKGVPSVLNQIYTIAIYSKSILTIIAIIVFFIVTYISGYFLKESFFFIIFSLTIIGNAFLPVWHYQGLEKLYSLTSGIVITKILSLIFIFLMVKGTDDFIFVALINASQILFVSLYYNVRILRSGTNLTKVSAVEIKKSFKDSLGFFLSRAAVSLYTTGCGVYLGIFSTPAQVAMYNVAEQLYRAGTQVFAPVTQAVYPYMIRTKNFVLYYKIIVATVVVSIVGALFGYFLGEQLITLIFGVEYRDAARILNVFMITIIFSTCSVMFGYPLLVPLGKAKQANHSVLIAGVVQVLCLIAIFQFSNANNLAIKVAYSVLLCELTVLTLRLHAFLGKK